MERFSERNSFAPARAIVDDAPRWFRLALFDQILVPYLCSGSSPKSISARKLLNRLVVLLRGEIVSPIEEDEVVAYIRDCLASCEWYEFYDSIEIITGLISEADLRAPSAFHRELSSFRRSVNQFLQMANSGWTLDGQGKLTRVLGESVTRNELAVESSGTIPDATKNHTKKARLLLERTPHDYANSVKESVSAIESAGRTLVPTASTLGDVVKVLKKRMDFPSMMADVIEKLYVFANAEPGVRHGGLDLDRVSRADAEFCHSISISILLYLTSFSG